MIKTRIQIQKLILASVFCLFAQPSRAQLSKSDADIVIFPWVVEQTSHEFRTFNQEALTKARKDLAESLGTKNDLLKTYAVQAFPVKNIEKQLKNFLAVEQDNQKIGPVLIQPYICRLQNDLIVASIIRRAESWRIEAMGHDLLPIEKNKKLDIQKLSKSFKRSFEQAKANIAPLELNHNLKVQLTPNKDSQYRLNSKARCLTYLLTEKTLRQNIPVTSNIGYDHYSILQHAKIFSLKPPTKPTRQLLLDWITPHQDTKDANSYQLEIWKSESIFGQHIPDKISFNLPVTREQSSYSLEVPPELLAFLSSEQNALAFEEKPKVSKIYRAWAYLDKGRAWGLKIGDRLQTVDEGGQSIKGHVVGFFGPNQKITSPRGYAVAEGAIVYIRKGQSNSKIGQEFTWDERSYPTPWPIKR